MTITTTPRAPSFERELERFDHLGELIEAARQVIRGSVMGGRGRAARCVRDHGLQAMLDEQAQIIDRLIDAAAGLS